MEVVVTAEYKWFKKWSSYPTKYRGNEYLELKEIIANKLFEMVFQIFPQIKNKIIQHELGTPLSSEFNLGSLKEYHMELVVHQQNIKHHFYNLIFHHSLDYIYLVKIFVQMEFKEY